MGTELGGAGSRGKNGIFGGSSVTPVVGSIVGRAPRTVCGARCLWRHASHTLHGEGSGGPGRGLGGGGALMNTSALAWTRGKQSGSNSGLWGLPARGGGGRSSLCISPRCFSSSSSWALRNERWRDLREVPTLRGFLFLSAWRGVLGCSC